MNTRHEEYEHYNELPFIIHVDLERSTLNLSKEDNWHNELEIQLCIDGEGTVLLNGKKVDFKKNDIVVVNSNVIHYTSTENALTYTCIIVKSDFCKQMGLEHTKLYFNSHIQSKKLVLLIKDLQKIYQSSKCSCWIAQLNKILLEILIELVANHSTTPNTSPCNNREFKNVMETIKYIRTNYDKKFTLDDIAKTICVNKYTLCREFKKYVNQTIIHYTNNYRCHKATNYIKDGYSIAQVAEMCGFYNLSFFSKTFKAHIGILPSEYKASL